MVTKPKSRIPASPDSDDVAAVDAARADVDKGKTASYERVRQWLLSWGTEKELPRPRCK